MEKLLFVFKKVFSDAVYTAIALSVAINALLIQYFIFLKSTTLAVFLQSNIVTYNILSISSAILISILIGAAVSFLVYHLKLRQASKAGAGRSILGGIFGAMSTGCPVCGTWVLSILGIGGGLAAFPFQGLELKGLGLFFVGWSVYSSASAIYNYEKALCGCSAVKAWRKNLPFFAGMFAIFLVLSLPIFAVKYNFRFFFQPEKEHFHASVGSSLTDALLPEKGYTVNAVYGNIGPEMIKAGVIDLEKFKSVYENSGYPLTEEQLNILTKGSNEKITINQENSYFLLNFFWAFGLINKNPILDEGPLMKYDGLTGAGRFASTGGWTLAKSGAMDYYSKEAVLALSQEQQKELEDFANNSYRPCCNNSVAFSDCNHGMALLGLGQVMASQGATAQEMFEAGKYFNSFWFPQQYFELAAYFKANEGKDWQKVDARTIMSKDYSSASGWSRVHSWLQSNGLLEQAPSSGGGCGV
ncbi:MAG: hypothetical protein HYV47_03925 [Candidatus Nealsonbacteria bacterium]|nr:hypothetical protein [Candidatus Nealsonbacteria bacterium]